MADYFAMYRRLSAAQADAVEGLQRIMDDLIRAHRQAEELYLNAPEPYLAVLHPEKPPLGRGAEETGRETER